MVGHPDDTDRVLNPDGTYTLWILAHGTWWELFPKPRREGALRWYGPRILWLPPNYGRVGTLYVSKCSCGETVSEHTVMHPLARIGVPVREVLIWRKSPEIAVPIVPYRVSNNWPLILGAVELYCHRCWENWKANYRLPLVVTDSVPDATVRGDKPALADWTTQQLSDARKNLDARLNYTVYTLTTTGAEIRADKKEITLFLKAVDEELRRRKTPSRVEVCPDCQASRNVGGARYCSNRCRSRASRARKRMLE